MKIATWNLERALPQSKKAERQRQWFSRIDADIWVLTETHLGITPGEGYHSIASGLPDRPPQTSLEHPRATSPEQLSDAGERWIQIWVRQEWAIAPLATCDHARTACALVTAASGQPYLVYGTVLPWLDSSWRIHPPKQAFAAALAAQQADWVHLRAAYPEAVLVVAGDFNQDLNALPYYGSRQNKLALGQALANVELDCLTAGENDPVYRLSGQHSNTDHICMTPNPSGQFQSSFAWPPRLEDLRGLSDHFGVGVDIRMGPPI